MDLATKNILKFKDKVDSNKYGEPSFIMILTGTKYSYKRQDGVYIGSLKD